jgi:hypothetical protein
MNDDAQHVEPEPSTAEAVLDLDTIERNPPIDQLVKKFMGEFDSPRWVMVVDSTELPPEYATSGYADYRPPTIDRSRGIAFRVRRLPRARRACGSGRPGGRRVASRSSGGGSSGDPDLSDPELSGERAGHLALDALHRHRRALLVVSCRPDCQIHATDGVIHPLGSRSEAIDVWVRRSPHNRDRKLRSRDRRVVA